MMSCRSGAAPNRVACAQPAVATRQTPRESSLNADDIYYLTATEALKLFSKRELSPVELLEAQIRRAAQVEPTINAFSDTYFEEAREQAKSAE